MFSGDVTQVSVAEVSNTEDAAHILDVGLEALALNSAAGSEGNNGEEQALESHEVIELQSFSERKTWIEEKIKVSIKYHRGFSDYLTSLSFLKVCYRSKSL